MMAALTTPPSFWARSRRYSKAAKMPIDVAFIQVSPPDSHGYCSFGVGVECTLTAAKCAHYVVAQVNAADAAHLRRQLHPCQ